METRFFEQTLNEVLGLKGDWPGHSGVHWRWCDDVTARCRREVVLRLDLDLRMDDALRKQRQLAEEARLVHW